MLCSTICDSPHNSLYILTSDEVMLFAIFFSMQMHSISLNGLEAGRVLASCPHG